MQLKPDSTVHYHLHGNNARVNIQSNDHSTNIVNLATQELFLQLRQLISEKVAAESKDEILRRLDDLEKTQNTPGFALSYTKFMAIVADHWTLISPFFPALMELAHKALS